MLRFGSLPNVIECIAEGAIEKKSIALLCGVDFDRLAECKVSVMIVGPGLDIWSLQRKIEDNPGHEPDDEQYECFDPDHAPF